MSDVSRYDDEIVISWAELHRDARYLSQQLHDMGSWKGIVAITRGERANMLAIAGAIAAP